MRPLRMNQACSCFIFGVLCYGLATFGAGAQDSLTQPAQANPAATNAEPPLSWVDPDTGHRIIRLTREPGSDSFYFNYNGGAPGGGGGAGAAPRGGAGGGGRAGQ